MWLREVDAKGLALSKMKSVEVRLNAYEDSPQKAQASLSPLGTAGGHFVLPQNARTGYYALEVVEPSPDDNGRTLGSIGVQVEEYRAPRFQAKVEARPRLILSGGTAEARGEFRYFAGGALGGQPVRWFLSLSPSGWQPPGWDGYSFTDEPPVTLRPSDGGYQRKRGYEGPTVLREGQATLDRNGAIDLEQTIVLPPETPDSYLSVEIGARDLADQSAFDSDGLMVVRGPLRVGVHTLWDEPEERSNQVSWEWAVVDTAGTIRAGIAATAELWRQDYKTARVRRLGGLFDYENFPADTLISRHELTSGAEPAKLTVRVPGPGDYRLRVIPKLPEGERIAASARAWVSGPEVSSAARPTTWGLSLDTEKSEYAPDDTVRLVIPAPVGGAEALVLLESGDLIRARRVSLSGTPRIEVPLLGLAPGGATIDAVLVGPDKVPSQPAEGAKGPRQFLPYHARGNAYFNVSNGDWEAKLELHPERETVAPGDSLGVDFLLTDAKGVPSAGEITLAVVDEAVLALVGDRAADPLSQLFGARHGQVIDDDLRTQLRLSPSLDKGKSSPGGGGAEAKSGLPSRANFRATAYWNASIVVGPDGRAHVSVPMPDDLTRYRLRAVAVTKKSEFAEAEGHITVSRPLEIEAAAPRFVRVGDAWSLGAVVRNRSGQPLEVSVRATVTGARLVKGSDARRKLSPGENWRVDFPIDTPSSGTIGYTLEASSTDGRFVDRVTRHLPAAPPLHREVEVAFGVAAPKGGESIDLADPGLKDGGALTIAASPTLLGGLATAVDYLTGYPHGCLEQIDSQILGLLTRRALLDRLPPDTLDAAALDRRVAAGLTQIDAQYSADGFRLWPESGPAGAYLNAYTLWTVARAAASGLALPEGLLARADQLLAGDLDRTEETALDPDTQAFLSWLRLEASGGDEVQVDDAALEKLYTYADELGTAGKMALALAYDRYETRIRQTTTLRPAAEKELRAFASGHIKGLVDTAAQSIDRTASQAALVELHPGWGSMYASSRDDRVRATALATLLLSRRETNHPLLPLFVRWLLLERRHGRWGNTHENAWALAALTEYASKAENLRFPIEARVVMGLGRPEGVRFEAGKLAPFARRYTLDELLKMRRADPSKPTLGVEVETGGQSPIFYDLRLDRTLPDLALPAREEGLTIYREYTTVNGVPLKKLVRGEPVLAHLAVVVPQASDFLMLEDPLPAGCEAVNLDFKTSSRTLFGVEEPVAYDFTQPEEPSEEPTDARFPVTHRELRDDRVRFYADEVGAGIYHLYYPITPTTPGRFGTPGARAELLYSPEVYATSGTDVVTVE
ncbi:MAG: alpha-2-macroglobulin family protein [Candidatus Eisenbacteria bacterium]